MGTAGIITLSITIAGFIFGIIATVSKLSVEYGKIRNDLDQNKARDKEERAHTREKFTELYTRISGHDSTLAALQNNVTNLTTTCGRIESKLDRLIEKESK